MLKKCTYAVWRNYFRLNLIIESNNMRIRISKNSPLWLNIKPNYA